MAVPVARVHLKVAHAALPALLPSPPVWKKLLPTTPLAPATAKPSRADADERWDAHKTKPGSAAQHHRPRQAQLAPPPSASRTAPDADPGARTRHRRHRRPSPAGPTPPSDGKAATARPSSAGSSSRKWTVSRASSAERWDAHKIKRCPVEADLLDDGDSSSTGSNDDVETEEEEEEEEEEVILWKPRAMYAGQGFAAAVPQPRMLPMPTAFLVPAA